MALTPERIAELERLKAMMQPLATDAKRKAQAILNAEKGAGQPVKLPTDKAKGGPISQDAMRLALPKKKTPKTKFVLDAIGKPLRVYHGTNQDIKSFDNSRLGQNTKQKSAIAHYFTENPQEAGEYANMAAKTQVANAPSHEKQLAKLQKQIQEAERRGDWDAAERLYLLLEDFDLGAINEDPTGQNIVPVHLMANKVKTHDMKHDFNSASVAELIKQAKAEKMHALKLENVYDPVGNRPESFSTNQWVIFDPKRIKSAIGNRGTYDPNDPDITKAQGGAVNAFDYENPEHVSAVAGHAAKHKDFKSYDPKLLGEVLSTGDYRHLEDPRIQEAMRKAGHNAYHTQEKTGKKLNKMQSIVKKAVGGGVQPSIAQMKMALTQNKFPSQAAMNNIGAEEAPNMPVKEYVPPAGGQDGQLPVGGIDMSDITPGMQYMPEEQQAMQPPGQPGQPAPQGPSPLSAGPSAPGQQSNILQMTPQGQAMAAMRPQQGAVKPQMAIGGPVSSLPTMLKQGGTDGNPMDNGATTFSIDDTNLYAEGGSAKKPTVQQMKDAIFQKAQEGLMKPSEALGKHEGKYLHITEADRAKVEKRKHGMRGGVGFSQIGLEDPDYEGRVWGVGKSGTAIKLLNRERRGLSPEDESVWSTFIGTPDMHTSNQLVFNRMWNKFQEARKAGLLSPEQEQQMLDIMRSAMTKPTKKSPPKPIFESDVNLNNTHHLFDTFERRRLLSDLMAGKGIGGKKGQIFDASKMIEDTTDPRLLHAPSLSVGPHVFSFNRQTSHEPNLNKAFPFMLHGTAHPEAFQQIPFAEAAPDFTNEIRQTKGREPGYMDIVRRIPRQYISEKYLTGLQKMGRKKGGKVASGKLSDNLDTMRLALTKKKAK